MAGHVEQKIREIAGQVAEELGVDLVEAHFYGQGRRGILRVAIDREGGVTLDDCELFSRRLEGLLDVEDPLAGPYTMEVSSPGIDRPLKSPDDFRKKIGKVLRIVTREKIDDESFFVGRLLEVRDASLILSLRRKKNVDVEIEIPFDRISRAQMEIEVK